MAAAAPPTSHLTFPVIAGTPAVLAEVLPTLVLAPVPVDFGPDAVAPEAFELVLVLVVPLPEASVAVGPPLTTEELDVTAAPTLPVMITGMKVKSVPVKVSVLDPGKLASVPPKDSAQTADAVPAREQSK
jgi:hypothetical protein